MDNGWARLYRMFGFEVCCPKDVRDAVEACPQGEELVFEINSGGGSVYMGFEMYSVIRGFAGRTVAEVQGIAASAASVVMAACDEVLMSPVAEVMIHRAQTGAKGNSAVMRQARQMLDTVDESILNAYVEKANGKTGRDEFARLMRNETFMTAQQAIDHGLADGILPQEAEGASPLRVTASASGGGYAELPSVDDLLRIAAAAGVELEGQDRTAEDAGRFVKSIMSGEVTGQQEREDSDMEIKTVDDLRREYPELAAEIEQKAARAATEAERTRIREIEDMALPGSEDLTASAKFGKPISAEDYAKAAMKRAAAQGSAYLTGVKKDAQAAGGIGQETPADNPTNEFLEAIRAAGKQQ